MIWLDICQDYGIYGTHSAPLLAAATVVSMHHNYIPHSTPQSLLRIFRTVRFQLLALEPTVLGLGLMNVHRICEIQFYVESCVVRAM